MAFDQTKFEDDVVSLFNVHIREDAADRIHALQGLIRVLASAIAEFNTLERLESLDMIGAIKEGESTAKAALDSLDVLIWAFVDGERLLNYDPKKFEEAYTAMVAPVTARLIRELSRPDTDISGLSKANIQGILQCTVATVVGPCIYPMIKSISDEEKHSLCEGLAEDLFGVIEKWADEKTPYLVDRYNAINRTGRKGR